MSDVTTAAIETILKNLTDRIALAIFFLCIILLVVIFIPGEIGNWMRNHLIWIFLGLLGSLCYLPTSFVLDKISESFVERNRNHRLQNLTKREREILAPYIRGDFRARRIIFSDPVAKGLADADILYTPNVDRNAVGYVAYNIQNWARLYLKKNPEIFSDIPDDQKSGDL